MPDLETTLSPYQREGRDFALANPRCLILDPPGLGKTLQAIGLMDALRNRGELVKTLVAVDGDVLARQWAAELERHLPDIPVFVANTGSTVYRDFQRVDGSVVLIATYALVLARDDFLTQFRWSLMVMDEVSALKGGAGRHKAAREVSRCSDRVLGLTATELENDATDTWAVLDAVGTPGLWSKEAFYDRFIEWEPAYRTPSGVQVPPRPVGLKEAELPELRAYLADVTIRRSEGDAGLTLPERTGQRVVWTSPTWAQLTALQRAERRPPGLSRTQAFDSACAVVGSGSAKALAAVEWLGFNPWHRKVLVFAHDLDHLDAVGSLLEEGGIGYVRIEGETKIEERLAAIETFNTDPDIRVLLGSSVLERGLDGLKCASALLSLGCSWNPAREEQREGRIRRRGAEHETYQHVTFLLDHPHERDKWARLEAKQNQANRLR